MIGSMVEYDYVPIIIFKVGTRYLYVPDNPGLRGGPLALK